MAAPAVLASSNSIPQTQQRQPFVCTPISSTYSPYSNSQTAKFSGYQYGGRPLGITFVKYMTPNAPHDDMMEGQQDHPSGLTQDQIM